MRNSSIELFRIIAMLFVVIVHCNGWLVGGIPDDFDETNISMFRVSQALIQSITCTCVNMYLLISGYFGLKLKWKTFLNIYMLLISITIPFYLLSCYMGEAFSVKEFLSRFMAISHSGYFVEGYLLLMFFSPVLNAFIDRMGNRIVYWVLSFWIIEVYFEFLIHDGDLGFNEGYSFIHFVLIYMIGRTLNIYKDKLQQIDGFKYVFVYLSSTFFIFAMYIVLDMKSIYNYSSPISILAASSLFMIFAKKTFYTRWINWLASSTFAVYIIHTTNPLLKWLRDFDINTLENESYPDYIITMSVVILLIFFGSILYDKVAKLFTVPIVNKVECTIHRIIKKFF